MTSLAQFASRLPPCALSCALSAVSNSTCDPFDKACTCASGVVKGAVLACIRSNCTIPQALLARNASNEYCGIAPTVDRTYISLCTTFLAIAGVFVLLRLIDRLVLGMRSLWWDDLLTFFTLMLSSVETTLAVGLTNTGMGTDLWAVPLADIPSQLRGYYISVLIYVLARVMTRASIIFFYFRVFSTPKYRRLIWITFACNKLLSLAFIIALVFECTPISYFWTRWDGLGHGSCIDLRAMLWSLGVILVVYDFWILMLPIPIVARLDLDLHKKLFVSAMFGVGILVIIASIYKLTLINDSTSGVNPTYYVAQMTKWGSMEIDLGIICACMPSLHSLARRTYRRFNPSMPDEALPWQGSESGGSHTKGDSAATDVPSQQHSAAEDGPSHRVRTMEQSESDVFQAHSWLNLSEVDASSTEKERENKAKNRSETITDAAWPLRTYGESSWL